MQEIGGRAVCVGGCVRDALLGQEPKDIDIEVFGVDPQILEEALSQRYEVLPIGKDFGVLSIKQYNIDVSVPRKEFKRGEGHRGFQINADPNLSFKDAAARRDFTINAISWDPLTDELIDPYYGLEDLQNKILRHTSPKFTEDPLRVLRGMQFIARFELTPDKHTVALSRGIYPENLSKERIFEEWKKLILLGKKPSLGLKFLKDTHWVIHFPELENLIDCAQDPEWHPEGDVWSHTLYCMDAFANERIGDEFEDLVVGLAVLCHDFGKPDTTIYDEANYRLRSPGHDIAGEAPTRSFLNSMTDYKDLIESVIPLVVHHLRPVDLFKAQSTDSAIRRLSRVVRLDRLMRVVSADMQGRPPKPNTAPEVNKWLMERAEALDIKNKAPDPIIRGRHLIALGMKQGAEFRPLLDSCYEAQIEGIFSTEEDGLKFLKATMAESGITI
ncbi:MAG: polynucleotide adenylyltransferase [Verrucomicrobia bacterium CG_4_10_14_3_um_filter_43_23]|nr:MAG: polynucleotide adenylyltransferase [Verrucomicrobia bacterium CG22_combo_CG10-13_8_21_14_all_43_17]PIX59036.1 MAG: polynucleotide adenylyltransferase [Verrucomicrobia bacterium CG_4_10_14_3_um_filter_43_23]PIY61616.1 MAG: polynucleotide adenylyltransferase [Verrucomicrobia bacterium CG_4_10_14_0_8_um_filter_43_34]PJA44525.1 MAG: polynucleotide adenylyltransferase [Verrucomicrobia bacterium CG_4_9_14_3_um_filter_43_20]